MEQRKICTLRRGGRTGNQLGSSTALHSTVSERQQQPPPPPWWRPFAAKEGYVGNCSPHTQVSDLPSQHRSIYKVLSLGAGLSGCSVPKNVYYILQQYCLISPCWDLPAAFDQWIDHYPLSILQFQNRRMPLLHIQVQYELDLQVLGKVSSTSQDLSS